jgi:ATP-dependent helicase STH1/SNF2
MADEIADHPELGDQDSSLNGGSTAPTTNAGTPMPASAAKLKLNFNKSMANGGSSGVQSDDE